MTKTDCPCGPCAETNHFTRAPRVLSVGLTMDERKAKATREADERARIKADVDAVMERAGFHPVTGKRLSEEA